MATQLLLGSTNDPTAQKSVLITGGESKPEPAMPRARKSGKQQNGPAQKKQPQRGMGVAQLERLRLQERWKKMTEISPSVHPHHVKYPNPYPYFDPPTSGVPVQLPKLGGFGERLVLHHGFPVHGGPSSPAHFFPDGFPASSYGGMAGAVLDPSTRGFGGLEGLRELPSIPKLDTEMDSNGIASKKKRIMEGTREKCEGVEVVAVHRKGNAVGGGVVMEYGFFPSAKDTMEFLSPSSTAAAGDRFSPFGSTETSIDLSLKL
ncbi:hypothetical protein Nepgr_007514 [Nepenthes gracilis]|uniref:Uncharacterized protein n=1 Tax=Nepenthes gracilis TaxID=150966 RepID=A0AAD3S7C2_NEPGR|nr:hypothetical protein Nepgr_007514 [Nepenthes gracilis]